MYLRSLLRPLPNRTQIPCLPVWRAFHVAFQVALNVDVHKWCLRFVRLVKNGAALVFDLGYFYFSRQ